MTSELRPEVLAAGVARAQRWHLDQVRKGTTTPYVSHLLAVASLVLEDEGDEEQTIAALLHDAAEDQGGEQRLHDIEEEFGSRVAAIVRACSDSLERTGSAKAPWRARKEAAVASLSSAPQDALIVVAADKLHNLRATILDLDLVGDEVWDRFNTDREGFLWYHRATHAQLDSRIPGSRSVRALGLDLARLTSRLEAGGSSDSDLDPPETPD